MTTSYERCRNFSEHKLKLITEAISTKIPSNDIVITCGSYARREASENSDLDYFVITKSKSVETNFGSELYWTKDVKDAISKHVEIEPSNGGHLQKL